MTVDPDHVEFWNRVNRNDWEKETFDLFDHLLRPESTFVDIGAWIGPTVLYASRLCRKVTAFEPDPHAYNYLQQNLKLNNVGNAQTYCLGVGQETGTRRLQAQHGTPGDSTSSLLDSGGRGHSMEVPIWNWKKIVDELEIGPIDLLKIDIEGGEFEVLPTMRSYLQQEKTSVYLSLHFPFLSAENRRSQFEMISDFLRDYRQILTAELQPLDWNNFRAEAIAGETFQSVVLMD